MSQPPYAPFTPPPLPTPPPRKRHVGRWILGGVGALVVLFIVIGSLNGGSTPASTTSAAATTAPAPVIPAATVAPVVPAPAPVPVPAPAPPAPKGIGDGTHIVGTDIERGTYRSSGAEPGLFEFCYWTTKAGASSNSKIIDMGSANADEQQVVEIGSGVKAFESNGCAPWTKVG